MRYVFFLFLLLSGTISIAQSSVGKKPTIAEHARAVAAFQHELNAEFADSARSPLPTAARQAFTGLPFYPANYAACVVARFVPDSLNAPFPMPTSTIRRPLYRKYGELHFMLDGQPQRLFVYQSLDLLHNQEYRDYLIVLFTDRTNGQGSYGGGRYLDLRRGQIQDGQLVLDFNRAYNPYCAYGSQYSCPIPPAENQLPVAIKAGVMSEH